MNMKKRSLNAAEPTPDPTIRGEACWDRAIADWNESFGTPLATLVALHAEIVGQFRERDVIGSRKYGVRLQPFDGRNTQIDLIQELMDALVYATKLKMEGDLEIESILSELRRMIAHLYIKINQVAS